MPTNPPCMNWSKVASILPHLWGLVLFILIFYRPLSSYALILLGAAVLASQFIRDKPTINWKRGTFGLTILLSIFLIYFYGFVQHMDHSEAWPRFEKKLPLLFIPLIWLLSRLSWKDIHIKVYLWLLAGIFTSGIIMFIGSTAAFLQTLDWHQFFYHAFTAPVKISAIYYSWFIVIAIAWPIPDRDLPFSKSTHGKIKMALAILLLISASKLFVVLGGAILAFKWFKNREHQKFHWKQMALLIIAGLLLIPVLIRTTSLLDTNMTVIVQDQYEHDSSFNGLTLRLIQVRLGFEVLQKEDAWILGVGPALSKSKLDERYKAHNMYTGNPELGDRGLLAYNYHNQWIETLVATGIIGLTFLLILFSSLIVRAYHNPLFGSMVIVCTIFMFTESFWEREQGLVLFTFLASALFKTDSID